MNVVVTGGRGFVGSRLVERLRAVGHRVYSFDIADGNDIADSGQVESAVRGADAVYHLAAELDEQSADLFRINVDGTKNILEACAKEKVGRLIFLSSVGVMGDIKGMADEKTPLNPKTGYEKSKAEAEKLVLSYQEALPVIAVRSALVLGPNKYWEQIIKMIEKGFPIIGSGKNKFQLVYIDDLVDALLFLLRRGEFGELYIVAEREGKTLGEIYSLIANEIGVKVGEKKVSVFTSKIVAGVSSIKSSLSGKKPAFSAAHIDRLVRERNYSIEKIMKLGWVPRYSAEEAIKETVRGLKKAA